MKQYRLGERMLRAAASAREQGRSGALWKGAVPLALLTLLWVRVFLSFAHVSTLPNDAPFGGDFAHNMAGAYVMTHGGNPYNAEVFLRGLHSYLVAQGIPNKLRLTDGVTVWYGYPPLYAWLLEPFIPLPFPLVTLALMMIMGLALAVAAFLCLSSFGWSTRLFPTLLFLTAPQTTFQLYYGNPASLVVAMVVASIAINRRFPFSAGLLLSLACLKPQLGVPGLLLLALSSPRGRGRIFAGFGTGTVVLLALTLLGPGRHSLVAWVQGLFSISGMAGQQVNMVPLMGLYAGRVPPSLHTVLEGLTVLAALGLTAWYWRRLRGLTDVPFRLVAWLWPLWMLALPYAHFPDEIVLLPATLAALGRNGRHITQPGLALCVYLLYGSTLLDNVEIDHVQLLSLPLIAVTILMYRHAAVTMPVGRSDRGPGLLPREPANDACPVAIGPVRRT